MPTTTAPPVACYYTPCSFSFRGKSVFYREKGTSQSLTLNAITKNKKILVLKVRGKKTGEKSVLQQPRKDNRNVLVTHWEELIIQQVLQWTSQGRRERERPRNAWERYLQQEMWTADFRCIWRKSVQDGDVWSGVICDLWSIDSGAERQGTGKSNQRCKFYAFIVFHLDIIVISPRFYRVKKLKIMPQFGSY